MGSFSSSSLRGQRIWRRQDSCDATVGEQSFAPIPDYPPDCRIADSSSRDPFDIHNFPLRSTFLGTFDDDLSRTSIEVGKGMGLLPVSSHGPSFLLLFGSFDFPVIAIRRKGFNIRQALVEEYFSEVLRRVERTYVRSFGLARLK